MKTLSFICLGLILMFFSCKQDDYYMDGGIAEAKFDGDMLQYLESKPAEFDTIAQIVKLAGLEEVFRKDSITFFAPPDEVIKNTIGTVKRGGLNAELYYRGKDTIKTLSDVDSLIWRKYLSRYIFNGKNLLKDYPQIDFSLLSIYPGGLYVSRSGDVSTIGVDYESANGVKYIGYRKLVISFIPDISNPDNRPYTNYISSSDIQPENGVVHTLRHSKWLFGFNGDDFMIDVINSGISSNK